jgi:hypothetical protein
MHGSMPRASIIGLFCFSGVGVSRALTASFHRKLKSISIHMQSADRVCAQRAEEHLYHSHMQSADRVSSQRAEKISIHMQSAQVCVADLSELVLLNTNKSSCSSCSSSAAALVQP